MTLTPATRRWAVLLLGCAAGWLFLLCGANLLAGIPPNRDEIEHAHAAWMLARGLRPYVDFFEHHYPGLWQLLAVYPRLFPDAGPEILYWGRFLCLLAAGLSSWLVYRIASHIRSPLAGWLSIVLWIPVAIPCRAASIRPEMPACVMQLGAMDCLLRFREGRRRDASLFAYSALLAGGAVYFTPRAIFWATVLFLSQARRMNARQKLLWSAGAALGPALILWQVGWKDSWHWLVYFNTHLTSFEAVPHHLIRLPDVTFMSFALLAPLYAVWRRDRRLFELSVVYLMAMIPPLFLEKAPYDQGFSCAAPLAVLLLVSCAGVPTVLAAFPFLWAWPYAQWFLRIPREDFLGQYIRRNSAVCRLLKTETALFNPIQHPIGARDATYYWFAVKQFQNPRLSGAPFRFIEEFTARRPALISHAYLAQLIKADAVHGKDLGDYVRTHYVMGHDRSYWVRADLARRTPSKPLQVRPAVRSL